MPTLNVFDTLYREATDAVVAERIRRGEQNINRDQVEKVIRSYVWLGLNKRIARDWTYAMSQSDQDAVINAVIQRTKQRYGFQPSYAKVYLNLQLLEDLAATGLVNPIIAQPRRYQELYESQLQPHEAFPSILRRSIQSVFEIISQGVSAVASGLGISPAIIVGVFALILFLIFKR